MRDATGQKPLSAADAKLFKAIAVASAVPTRDLALLHEQLRSRLAEPDGRAKLQEMLRLFWRDTRQARRATGEREDREISFTDCEDLGLDIPGVERRRGEDGDSE